MSVYACVHLIHVLRFDLKTEGYVANISIVKKDLLSLQKLAIKAENQD